jgi:hypothetical protein
MEVGNTIFSIPGIMVRTSSLLGFLKKKKKKGGGTGRLCESL